MPSPLALASPLRIAAASTAALLLLTQVPWAVSAREADDWYEGAPPQAEALAAGVDAWTRRGVTPDDFGTGSALFDEEWVFGTWFMAAMGFGQLALLEAPTDPAHAATHLAQMERCLDGLVSPPSQAFEARMWGMGTPGPDTLRAILDAPTGHAAYLGYLGVALGLHERLAPDSRWTALYRQVTTALDEHLLASPTGVLETYPDERYPVDNAAVITALALDTPLSGRPHASVDRWLAVTRAAAIDPTSGLLVQSLDARGQPRDAPRGSGTLLAAWFLGAADLPLADELYTSARRELYGDISGYGMMREYKRGHEGAGDIDSGPIVLGYGVSATGFGIGAARRAADPDTFAHLFATSWLFGAPSDREGERHYGTGGPLGDAILFAMLTTPRPPPAPPHPEAPRPR